jgi:magnesium-transporting ATPase (P-type)
MLTTVLLKSGLMTHTFVWLTWFGLIASFLANVGVQIAVELLGFGSESGVFAFQYAMPLFYFVLLLVPVVCLLPDVVLMYLKHQYLPSDVDVVNEEETETRRGQKKAKRKGGRRGSGNRERRRSQQQQEEMVQMTEVGRGMA